MNLSASESKRLEALRAKATLNAKEQSELDVKRNRRFPINN